MLYVSDLNAARMCIDRGGFKCMLKLTGPVTVFLRKKLFSRELQSFSNISLTIKKGQRVHVVCKVVASVDEIGQGHVNGSVTCERDDTYMYVVESPCLPLKIYCTQHLDRKK